MTVLARLVAAVALAQAGTSAQEPQPNAIVLEASPALSTDGTLDLTWSPGPSEVVSWQIEEATEGGGESTLLDAGRHRAAARSGLANGTYVYRVRAVEADGTVGAWSDPVAIEVRHHALELAFAFFGVGAFVFLATARLVVSGHRRAVRGED